MKKALRAVLILLVIFLAAGAAMLYVTRDEEEEEEPDVYEGAPSATLPVVYSLYEGQSINRLFGYTQPMKEEYIRDAVTPLDADGQMSILVDLCDSPVTSLSYEVRDPDTGRLIESTQVTGWTASGGQVSATLPIQKLIEEGREYLLCLTLSTEEHEAVYYYTRILSDSGLHVGEMIDFVTWFSDRTREEEEKNDSELSLYLEPDSTGDNSSLAFTNIHSSHSMVTWYNLEPERVTDFSVDLCQLAETVGTLRLSYEVTAQDESGKSEQYDVEENFVIRWSETRFYLLAYERTVNERFRADAENVSGGVVNLGVVDESDILAEANGAWTAFTAGGDLWNYNARTGELVQVYAFGADASGDVRLRHAEHGYKLIDADPDGNLTFLVYGYMNSGRHEGEVAMVFWQYSREDGSLTELFYIPSYTSFDLLKEEMDSLCFISDSGMVYVCVETSLYAIDVVGAEHVVVVDDVWEGRYVINEDGSAIAWQEGSDPYSCTSLSVLYLATGEKLSIRAGAGEYVKPLGFVGTDFLYGRANAGDITADCSGMTVFPMFAMEIVDETGETVTHYEKAGSFITQVEVDDGRIAVTLSRKDETGQFAVSGSDVLLRNTAEPAAAASLLSGSTNTRQKKVWSISRTSYASEDAVFTLTGVKSVSGTAGSRVDLSGGLGRDTDPRYYAYSYGHVTAVCYRISDAVAAVYDDMGVVVDAGANVVWVRAVQAAEARVSVDSSFVTDRADLTLAPCIQALLSSRGISEDAEELLLEGLSCRAILSEALSGRALDLSGCDLSSLLYYMSEGHPVIVLTGQTTADLMVGYDNYNVTFYSPTEGTTYKMGRNDTSEYLENAGAYLFSCR